MIKSEGNYNQKNTTEKNGNIEDSDYLRKLFIGGLPPTATEESLRNFYSQWGDVVDSVVMRDAATKRSRGFGFITYANPQMVDRAQAARPHVIDGKTVDSKRALPRPELGKSESNSEIKKIFVGGLKENHDEQALSDHFSQFGKIVSIKILTDKATGRKRGFAFIEYDDYDSVDKAILHKNHTIKYVLVDVKKSSYKQELAKKGQVQPQNAQQQAGAPQTSVPPGGYLPTGGYNPHAPYGYPPQMPPPAYSGWNGYAQPPAPGYQQPPAAPYGPYGMPPAAPWGPYGAQQPWGGQNGAVGPVPPPQADANAANGWGDGTKNFGNYQQSYNGGPQKAGNLQANRVNPYSAPNYGSGGNQAKPSNAQFQDHKSSNYNGYTNQKKMIRPF